MQPSRFNLTVPLPGGDVFIMNTLTDAQAVVSADAMALVESLSTARPVGDQVVGRSAEEREAIEALAREGFLVESQEAERDRLEEYFRDFREETDALRLTVLTTLQCNFACGYCIQGDHGDYNRTAKRMSLETAAGVVDWVEARLDALTPSRFVLTFFGGEPLLNLPVLYYLAEQLKARTDRRGVTMTINVITNGLLLTPEIVDRLKPCGLQGVKVTLDGDRETHDQMRPLRGGQGTFDRIIANLRQIAGKTRIAIGGNFDQSSVHSYPALLDFLASQDFSDSISKVTFKPVIGRSQPAGLIPLTAVDATGKPLGGACMTSAGRGTGGSSPCDSCHFVDEQMSFLRDETKRYGFATLDGVHMGPCEIHKRHAYTIGPDGDLYACPGFAGDEALSVGHIDGRSSEAQSRAQAEFERVAAWRRCGDCAFIPVCGGGCTVASHNELGDMHAPTCHKSSFESALVSLAQECAGVGPEAHHEGESRQAGGSSASAGLPLADRRPLGRDRAVVAA